MTDLVNADSASAVSGALGAHSAKPPHVPLYVDLDGTLIKSDLLWESIMLLVRHKPLAAWQLPLWVVRGKAGFKDALAHRIVPDAHVLPYREDVLAFIREQKSAGRRIILATASHQILAAKVSEHLALFDEVLASDATTNLSGEHKLSAIQQSAGGEPFDYMGDSAADIPLCKAAQKAYVVGSGSRLSGAIGSAYDPARRMGEKTSRAKALFKAIRPTQWSKNLLIFVPLMTAHKINDLPAVAHTALAFVAFCLCASAVYLLNDLLDIESDRQHPRKKNRPLASGKLSIPTAIAVCGLLFLSAFALSFALLPLPFVATLAIYLLMTTLYSLWIKTKLLMDVIVLAGLYTLRIIAGGNAATPAIELSEYLLAFSMFMFVSLAVLKRYTELLIMQDRSQRETKGRSYITDDLSIMEAMGPAIGCMAVLVMAFYIQYITHPMPGDNHPPYKHPLFLWGVCPVLLYWIMRTWVLARRRHFNDDPIAFALRDRVSWIAGILAVAAVFLASH